MLAIYAATLVSSALGQTAGSASKAPSKTPAKSAPRATEQSPPRSPVQRASNNVPEPAPRRNANEAPARPQNAREGATQQAPAAARPQQEPAATQPPAPKPPFVLTESQQKLLDQILLKWQKQSDKVKTFKCTFTRWEYDTAFGNPKDDFKKSEGQGQIKYKSPDCGEYTITHLDEFDPTTHTIKSKGESLDHWLCDGKSIFEFNTEKKQLIERRLPPDLQGQAIADGPLPFIFGAKSEQLKRRYWMRDVTPQDEIGKSVWLEAIPKFQQDAANFRSATIILNDADFMPKALRIFMPGGKANSDYAFASAKTNDPLAPVLEFLTPKLSPILRAQGWKYVLEEEPGEAPKTEVPKKPAAASGEPAQARRATPGRK